MAATRSNQASHPNQAKASRARLVEIVGIFRGEKIRWGEVCIGLVEERLPAGTNQALEFGSPAGGNSLADAFTDTNTTIKGPSEPDELQIGLSYRFYGRWTHHPKHGRQFVFQTFVRSQPHGQSGVIRYLDRCPNVGEARARKLWKAFGSDAVRILREQPEVAQAAIGAGFTSEMADAAAAFLARDQRLEATHIDLIDLLGGRGFPRNLAKRAIEEWGNRAGEIINGDPYKLMRFRGVGFLRCDCLYLELGLPPARLKRQAYAAAYAIASDTEGHTWHSVETAVAAIKAKVSAAMARPEAALVLAKRGGLLAVRRDERDRIWLADAKKAAAEERVAKFLAAAMRESSASVEVLDVERSPLCWPAADSLVYITPHQAAAYALLTRAHVGLLTGSPGTGKTFEAAAIIRAVVDQHGPDCVAVAAPTGKAAVRLTEAMDGYGLSIQATTIHRLLRVSQRSEGDGWGFQHGEDDPLPFRFLFVDEASMLSTDLMASLLAARPRGCHLLFIGDPNQLPPVGHGAPLRDMIAAGIPCGELREIHRNAGSIVRVCAKIRDGEPWRTDRVIDIDPPAHADAETLGQWSPRNLYLAQAGNPEEQTAKMLSAIEAVRDYGGDPIWDCQVLVPVNARSQLARKELNKALQRELNPGGKSAGKSPFRVGDKIINLKNQFFSVDEDRDDGQGITNEDGKVFVANGELGEVLRVEDNLTIVELANPRRVVKIPRGTGGTSEGDGDDNNGSSGSQAEDKADTGCQWDLGYAVSVHKFQGSETDFAIVMLDEYPGARYVCSREWLYTALSRAKKLCILIGKKGVADSFCRRRSLENRKTFLTKLIQNNMEAQ